MLVHNDWTITEPLVAFYSDRVVFTFHGGLPQGMSEEEFYYGVSHPRNSALMRIFLNIGIVEHTGHGVPMIVQKYGCEAFSIHESYIDVTIPFDTDVIVSMPQLGTNDGTDTVTTYNNDLSKNESRIILELIKKPAITYSELADETGISRRTVSRVMAMLTEKRYIKRIGNNKSGYWSVIQ